jgi:hypothetical protein
MPLDCGRGEAALGIKFAALRRAARKSLSRPAHATGELVSRNYLGYMDRAQADSSSDVTYLFVQL